MNIIYLSLWMGLCSYETYVRYNGLEGLAESWGEMKRLC